MNNLRRILIGIVALLWMLCFFTGYDGFLGQILLPVFCILALWDILPSDTKPWIKILFSTLIALIFVFIWGKGSLYWVSFNLPTFPIIATGFLLLHFLSKPIKPAWYLLLLLPEAFFIIALKLNTYPIDRMISYTNLFWIPDLADNILLGVIILTPIVMSLKTFGWGKGLFFGAVFSLAYIGIDFFVFKSNLRTVGGCGDFCGLGNLISAIGVGIYGILGLLIMFVNKIRSSRSLPSQVY
jgi:hypothetical protein